MATRRVILEAAAKVFAENGYDKARISDILREANVTKGALYFHFTDKQALADTLLTEHVSEIRVEPDAIKLRELMSAGYTLVDRLQTDVVQRAAARLTLEQGANQLDRAQPMLMWTEYVEELLTVAHARGELLPTMESATARRDVAEMIVGSFAGIELVSDTFSAGRGPSPLQHWLTVFFQTVIPTLAHPPIIPLLGLASAEAHAKIVQSSSAA
ncbi:ScbR family autoregulator-binding transcription factor [Streptomyces sp. NPDC017993]|uniref:ScbR family autoregulator-binding transcription factor n=1 Tax=Streptomyces sp. NPDC017993 TaxID=3365027 RepID=UPI003792D653